MLFTRYSHEDADLAKAMMEHHVDYTQQYLSDKNSEENRSYFEENFIDTPYQNLSYMLKAEDGDLLGLMVAGKEHLSDKWNIEVLFIVDEKNADEYAQYMFEQFCALFHEKHLLVVNLHPRAERAAAFWESIGFVTDLDKPTSTNAEDEVLTTYWKEINS